MFHDDLLVQQPPDVYIMLQAHRLKSRSNLSGIVESAKRFAWVLRLWVIEAIALMTLFEAFVSLPTGILLSADTIISQRNCWGRISPKVFYWSRCVNFWVCVGQVKNSQAIVSNTQTREIYRYIHMENTGRQPYSVYKDNSLLECQQG